MFINSRYRPSLNSLHTFESAARLLSFKYAAKELHVSPAAVSRQIKRLESQLGQDLFVRHHRHLELTPKGRIFADSLNKSLSNIAQITDQLFSNSPRIRRLTVNVEREFAKCLLGSRMKEFFDYESETDIEVIPVTEFNKDSELAPINIVYGKSSIPNLRQKRLLKLHAFPVCAPNLQSKLKKPSDLNYVKLIHEKSTYWWERWLAAVDQTSVNSGSGHIFHENSLALEAAITGQGVAMGDNLLALNYLESGKLVKPFDASCKTGSYYLVNNDNHIDNHADIKFCEWLVGFCKELQQLCDGWK